MSCHGGDQETESHVFSVYHRWLNDDPHARAGEVLFESPSRQIGQRLGCVDATSGESRVHLDKRCLACHSPAAVSSGTVNVRLLADGVGCEACHGGAKDWLEPHRSIDWKNPLVWPAERKAAAGFRDMEDLVERSRACAECHVGGTQKDVNHDFIAAGHPRLTYEFAAYDTKMPAHWFRSDDRRRSAVATAVGDSTTLRSNYAARAWLVGQWTAAEQQLTLLIDRAGAQDAPWPELAEYACYSCHQQLKVRASDDLTAPGRRPGQMVWKPWTLALLDQHPTTGLEKFDATRWTHGIEHLRAALERPGATRYSVLQNAQALRAYASTASQLAATTPLDDHDIRLHLEQLLAARRRLIDDDWETAAQLYLAVVALEQGYFEASAGANGQPGLPVELLLQARNDLRFVSRPGEIGGVVTYDSPVNFDRDTLRDRFSRIADQFGRAAGPPTAPPR